MVFVEVLFIVWQWKQSISQVDVSQVQPNQNSLPCRNFLACVLFFSVKSSEFNLNMHVRFSVSAGVLAKDSSGYLVA
jgi:hypothetical protein